ncbi:general substrate transporter [Lineolata rhizophorae]|uniref:General substrate transporter n=1 Tax=Lineolata rhizophorae TaxID=578093 RepID=A0A6A6NNS0_9PEZI|nr:general substrate transporter [Lineolata rhizophorae]
MDPRTWLKDLTGYFIFILFVATIGPLLFGFHLSELNPPEDVIRCKRESIHSSLSAPATTASALPQCIPMDPTQWGLVGSIFTLGGLSGALAAGPIAAKRGRLLTMRLTTIFFTLGPVFEALAPNIGVLALGRFVSGVGAGAALVAVPLYISEVAPPKERGLFGSLTQVMVNVGILIAQLLGFFLSKGNLWRVILAAGGAIGAAQAVGLVLSVESPRWNAHAGRKTRAVKDLHKIRGEYFEVEEEIASWDAESDAEDETEATVRDEEQTLLAHDERDAAPRTPSLGKSPSPSRHESRHLSIIGVLRDPASRRAVLAVVGVMLAQQLTGINSIIMYGVSLLTSLLSARSAALNLGVSALNVVVTFACSPLVDRWGRRTCLLSSIAGMGISSLLLAAGILRHVPALSAVAVLTFVASFGLGLGPVPFILASELVGPAAVGAAQSWALAANWIATFVVAQFFPLANERLGGKVYFVFAALAAVFWVFVALGVPESKGKKSVDEVWGREPPRSERED